jgi:hypothetical protein
MVPPVIDRRRSLRVACAESGWSHMRLRTGDRLRIVDIGAGGALVECCVRLMPGAALVVQLAGPDRATRLQARVLRCSVCALEPGGGVRYRGALEFAPSPTEVVARPSRPLTNEPSSSLRLVVTVARELPRGPRP